MQMIIIMLGYHERSVKVVKHAIKEKRAWIQDGGL